MNNSLVSIIVPIYNGQAFLDTCVKSITNQSYRNIEIILVDDGSTDSSSTMCDDFASRDERIKVIHKVNGGLVSSRKAGLELSSGDYIVYVDGDDWIEPNLVTDYMEHTISGADVVVASHIVNLEGRMAIIENSISPGLYNKHKLTNLVYHKMLCDGKFSNFGICSYSWGKLFKREILVNNQLNVPNNIVIGEDALCLYPSLLDSSSIRILKTPYYHYRQRTDSQIKISNDDSDLQKIQILYDALKSEFNARGVLDIMLLQLQKYILSLLTVRHGNAVKTDAGIYPFGNVKPNSNIILCGAGTFGQHLYKRISTTKSYNLLAWVDDWSDMYTRVGLPVTGFDNIEKYNYNYIIVAYINEITSNEITSKLLKLGVPKSSILQVKHYTEKNIINLLTDFNINV